VGLEPQLTMTIDLTKYENMRLLFLDFIDTASDEIDEEAWKDKLTTLDELLSEVKRLQKALDIEQQIVQAFYEYRDDCCFDHCEAWMLEKGHRVIVNGQSEWKNEVE
tara:strand:- start:327 stop:647 length:321 start_codon:yes stop_codon:yes gene_type:complete